MPVIPHIRCVGFAMLVGAAFAISSPAHAQGEACVAIDNDIARLQCFDEVFTGRNKVTLSPEEAYDRFVRIASISILEEDLTILNNYQDSVCDIEVIWKRRGNFAIGSIQNAVVVISKADLRKVQKVSGWGGENLGRGGIFFSSGIVLDYDRGSEGSYISYGNNVPVGFPAIQLDAQKLGQVMSDSGRQAKLFTVADVYKADADKIYAALEQFVEACRQ